MSEPIAILTHRRRLRPLFRSEGGKHPVMRDEGNQLGILIVYRDHNNSAHADPRRPIRTTPFVLHKTPLHVARKCNPLTIR